MAILKEMYCEVLHCQALPNSLDIFRPPESPSGDYGAFRDIWLMAYPLVSGLTYTYESLGRRLIWSSNLFRCCSACLLREGRPQGTKPRSMLVNL